MNKDVIYIDVEDDITAIIGKVKDAKEKVVALVPPKRIGVLQSAVNLRLIKRAAEQHNKHLVLITNNQALLGLSSSAQIPVAKNLQSKPEIPEIAALSVDDDDDIIDGEQLPVGDHAAMAGAKTAVPDSAIADLDIDDDTPRKSSVASAGIKPSRPQSKGGSKAKVPSFSTFRKKLFIFGGLGVILLAFLIWAIWIAPRATVIIDAKTTDKDIRMATTLGPDVETSADDAGLASIVQQSKKQASVDFDATGTKDVGEKARGTVRFATDSYSALLRGVTIPAGTPITSTGGKQFYTDRTVQLSIGSGNSDSTGVTAAESGESYNGASGSVLGGPSGVSANFVDATSGGTSKTVKIVLQADVQKAKQQLVQQNNDEEKRLLTSKFAKDMTVIDTSFTVSAGDPASSPGIGEEAPTGKAKLTSETTYMLTGVTKSNLDTFLKQALESTLTNKEQQRVYDTGIDSVKFTNFKQGTRTATVTIEAVGKVGPKIDDAKIKEQVKGKRYGEIQADLKSIDGVNDADTKFWPFWVSTVPNDTNKIKIEFKLQNGSQN